MSGQEICKICTGSAHWQCALLALPVCKGCQSGSSKRSLGALQHEEQFSFLKVVPLLWISHHWSALAAWLPRRVSHALQRRPWQKLLSSTSLWSLFSMRVSSPGLSEQPLSSCIADISAAADPNFGQNGVSSLANSSQDTLDG